MNIQDQCADCGKEFSSRLCFNKHYREYHQKNESNWQCQQCLWKSNQGQGLLWCDPGLRGWSTGGSSQGHLGCLKSILLRQNKHSHPLIYMRGMKSDDLFEQFQRWFLARTLVALTLWKTWLIHYFRPLLFTCPEQWLWSKLWEKIWRHVVHKRSLKVQRNVEIWKYDWPSNPSSLV